MIKQFVSQKPLVNESTKKYFLLKSKKGSKNTNKLVLSDDIFSIIFATQNNYQSKSRKLKMCKEC